MKIVYCCPALHTPGGVERVILLKANYFADNFGYEVYIITTEDKDRKAFYPVSPKIKQIDLDINFDELMGASRFKKISGYLRKQKKFRNRLKKVLFELKPDIVISTLRREINFINSIKDGSHKIGEIHNTKSFFRSTGENASLFAKCFCFWWMRQLINHLKKLDRFVALTHKDKLKWKELNQVEVIHNPISFFPEQASDCLSRQVIAVGRYTCQKGFDILFEAWKIVSEKHPDWILRIYGGGKREDYQPIVDSLGISKTCILETAVSNIDEKHRESSIYVMSSRYEGFPMALPEAMSCGLPAVSFDCDCGPSEIINDGEDGFLVEMGNINVLAEKIIYLIENENIRIKMGQQARKNIERFKIEKIAQQWKNLFESVRNSLPVQNP